LCVFAACVIIAISFLENVWCLDMVAKKALKKVEDEHLRDYELVLILSSEVTEDGLEAAIGKVSQFITERGGALSVVEQWGKSKLAYPIKHFMEGSYVLTRFKLKPALTSELEANLQVSEEVLRHLLVKLSG
jgi:small subunit ribosomal protein S6